MINFQKVWEAKATLKTPCSPLDFDDMSLIFINYRIKKKKQKKIKS